LCKKQAQRSQKSALTLSKTSPERLIFEKTGVEIQCRKCCGHLDMTPVSWSPVRAEVSPAMPLMPDVLVLLPWPLSDP
jgi:hypothetical protein